MKDAVIIGCGYTGKRLALQCLARGQKVTALVRSRESAAQLQALGVNALAQDLDQAGVTCGLELTGTDLYYLAPPPPQGREELRLRRFLDELQTSPGRFLLLSTSGVYGDCGGALVDESRTPEPLADRAWRRWDGEQALREWSLGKGCDYRVIRVAGIYGPGKLPLSRLRRGEPIVRSEESPLTNRIHVDDLVQGCLAAMERGQSGGVYNICDGQPGTMADYFDAIADRAGLPRPPKIGLEQAQRQLSAGMQSYLAESRQLDNRRLREELGVELRFPDLAAGLDDCFSAASDPC